MTEAQKNESSPHDRLVLSTALFDAVDYDAISGERDLLRLAARYYTQVRESGVDKPSRAGRDLVLAQPLDGLDAEQQCIVASVIAFQGDKLKRDQELSFLRLDAEDQAVTLRLAAILSLADALATQKVDVATQTIEQDGQRELTLILGGERAAHAIEVATERDWRWLETIGPLTIRAAAPEERLPLLPITKEDEPPLAAQPIVLLGEQGLAESARRSLRRHFEKMLGREADVRGGEDAEDVHQMRVATRRLRASLQVVAAVFDVDVVRDFRRKLRFVAEALGHVRDADVFLEHVHAYRETLAAARKPSLDELVSRIEAERAVARTELLIALDSKRYSRFKHRFARFLTTPYQAVVLQAEHGGPVRVRDLAGSLIWHRYEDLRSFEAILPLAPDEQLHQMRIAGKRLRYTLEFFSDALGDGVDDCLKPLADLQDVLGSLQDSVVARERIERLGFGNAPGPQSYLARRESERTKLLRQMPVRWARVNRPTYRRRLFELISAL